MLQYRFIGQTALNKSLMDWYRSMGVKRGVALCHLVCCFTSLYCEPTVHAPDLASSKERKCSKLCTKCSCSVVDCDNKISPGDEAYHQLSENDIYDLISFYDSETEKDAKVVESVKLWSSDSGYVSSSTASIRSTVLTTTSPRLSSTTPPKPPPTRLKTATTPLTPRTTNSKATMTSSARLPAATTTTPPGTTQGEVQWAYRVIYTSQNC